MEGHSELNSYPISFPPASEAENAALSHAIITRDAIHLFPGMRFDRTYLLDTDGYCDALCAYNDCGLPCAAICNAIVQSASLPILSLSWCLQDLIELRQHQSEAHQCARILIRGGAVWPPPASGFDITTVPADLIQLYNLRESIRATRITLLSLRGKRTCLGGSGRNVIPLIVRELIKLLHL